MVKFRNFILRKMLSFKIEKLLINKYFYKRKIYSAEKNLMDAHVSV